MSLVLQESYHFARWALVDLPDPRVKDLFLVNSHYYPTLIVLWYAWLIFIGPDLMKNRQPFKLESIMTVYNVVQVVTCFYHAIISTYYVYNFGLSLRCAAVEYEVNEKTDTIIRLMYFYYLLKILDLVDTVFLVLRKKSLSFLHCSHHGGMVVTVYGALIYVAGGHTVWPGVINSYVHSVMYFYYLLCSYNKSYKASIWWKKYITQMQILQFSIVTVIYGQLVFSNPCGYPMGLVFFVVMAAVTLTLLFADFYYTAYIKETESSDDVVRKSACLPRSSVSCDEN